MRSPTFLRIACALLSFGAGGSTALAQEVPEESPPQESPPQESPPQESPQRVTSEDVAASTWSLWALEYARSEGVPQRRLVYEGSDAPVAMSWLFFVAAGHGRLVLIDCGSDALADPRREGLRRRWHVVRADTVVETLARVGVEPAQVTDVVLTHHHWDHVGGLRHFTRARVHAQPGEWARIPERFRRGPERTGRVALSPRRRLGLAPGLTAIEAGLHTAHHRVVRVQCADGPRVLVSDAAYLRLNIAQRRAVAISASPSRNVAAVARFAEEVGAANVIPGHDRALFLPGETVARLC